MWTTTMNEVIPSGPDHKRILPSLHIPNVRSVTDL